MIAKLDPPIPVETPKGKGLAGYVIDYGPQTDLYWIVYLEDKLEYLTFNNRDIHAQLTTFTPRVLPGQEKLSA